MRVIKKIAAVAAGAAALVCMAAAPSFAATPTDIHIQSATPTGVHIMADILCC
ncbi:hypothetical protein GCM10010277_86500 [Streptomyces longisporoflavus]|uniref:hypothetical protein n=1 Tax=Streptomyces longisporoflavus TaxID=28044 RepID=UPI00167E4F2C|nr:hypothetical protein [Streptomyces longisporoflavus]GGV72983.1 hypothetical protein GCM10010277_86500 [Streptomyces longisporoflavus]